MNTYQGLELRRQYLLRLKEIHATYMSRKSALSWLDIQRIEKLGRRIMRLISRLESLPQHKLTQRELRKARKESYVISELLKVLELWVAEARAQKSVKRIQRSRS